MFPELCDGNSIPDGWGSPKPNKKPGTGYRWQDPLDQGNGIRIDKGNPNSPFPSQRVDHVVVRCKGRVIGRDGNPINGSIVDDAENAHIPFNEWIKWKNWNSPK